MNDSPNPFEAAPIARPDGSVAPLAPLPPIDRSDWKSAPQIVRSVRFLNLFITIMAGLGVLLGTALLGDSQSEGIQFMVISGLVCAFFGWLAWAQRRGLKAGWIVQIVVSILGLPGFPVGTLLSAYILLNWFSPETKHWFGHQ